MQVNGLAAVVTGGGSGMGAATARALAAAGAKVALLDINVDAVKNVAEEIGGLAIQCDVTNPESATAALAEAAAAHGAARVLVNCAGILLAKRIVGRNGPMPLDDFSKVINVNVMGTFNMMRLAAEGMSTLDPLNDSGERGIVINTASIAAYEGQVGQSAYSASKGAIVALTLPAAREFSGFGIRVLTIAPGLVETPMLGSLSEEVQEALAASVPFPKRLTRPDEFSKLVLHMIDNEMLNGEVIRLDGAIRLAPK